MRILPAVLFLSFVSSACALDADNDQQSDIWEMIFDAGDLLPGEDPDGDGWSNAAESSSGTDPFDASSFSALDFDVKGSALLIQWTALPGKRYALLASADLTSGSWAAAAADVSGPGGLIDMPVSPNGELRRFFRLSISDQDADADGINDWEEHAVGFDPTRARTDRNAQTDGQRVPAGIIAPNTITVSVYDDMCSERWPDPGVIVVRRSGGLQPLEVNVGFGGTAVRGVDYDPGLTGNTVSFVAGEREVFVEVAPLADSDDAEATETVTLTALAGAGYTVGGQNAAPLSLFNEAASSGPSAKPTARFLIQAGFGPDQDSDADADQIPENVEEVMQMGFASWIDDQFTRPIGKLQPFVQWAGAQPSSAEIYNDIKQDAWWGRAMGVPKLRPDAATTQLPDPLRQRVGFALSQIFVISDRMEDLGVDPEGMTNFYDMLLTHALGNFRDLLFDVSVHPCMGIYLSHLGNRKPDPANNIFPDENYAREVMQLFSIGLWMLNPNGTRQLDAQNQPIATYGNANITEFARVFTGLAFGNNANFGLHPRDFTVPMKGWDAEHDLGPKTLLLGATTPARIASTGNTGTATMADVNAAMDNLFNHPNVGPFIGRLLIQRLVTSNPSPAYVGRVAAKFADNGTGLRGDMKAVVKQILLDPEARDPAMLSDPAYGKLREPFLKCVNLARAFNAASQEGWYYLDAFTLDHVEEPLKSPSVFNFYLPSYTPPGVLAQNGLVAPEFQIINASSGVKAPNYFWNAIDGGLHRWGVANPARNTKLNLGQEMLMNVPPEAIGDPSPNVQPLDPDALLRRLDFVLTGGTLSPRSFQIIREALMRVGPFSAWEWPTKRLKLAIYLIVTSPEFAVQR